MGSARAMSPRTPIGHDLLERLASLEAVDGPAKQLAKAVRGLKAPAKVNEVLSGTWLGHPVHPLLVMLPMGSWTSAVVLDWLGGEDSHTAADILVGTGLATALPTVATGYADWADTEPGNDPVRRIGIIHAAFNGAAAGLFAASLVARAAGSRGRGRLLALAGLSSVGVGGYLGGHLTYAEGVGVDHDDVRGLPGGLDPGARGRRAGGGRDEGRRRRRRLDPDRAPAAGTSTRSRTPACTAAARWPTASSPATASSARCTPRASGSRTARSSRARPPTRSPRSRRACARDRSRSGRHSQPSGQYAPARFTGQATRESHGRDQDGRRARRRADGARHRPGRRAGGLRRRAARGRRRAPRQGRRQDREAARPRGREGQARAGRRRRRSRAHRRAPRTTPGWPTAIS